MTPASLRKFCTAALAVLALTYVEVAAAVPFLDTSGLAAPDQVITFSEVSLPADTAVGNQFAAFGLTLSPGLLRKIPRTTTG